MPQPRPKAALASPATAAASSASQAPRQALTTAAMMSNARPHSR
eukprot:CAMPEP_0181487750 /NCGR_PEP_ID=MMETSP1110-20121109/47993_1 /TAXON_ID=174948 /ORGANISM="Symbiodinium sp., Strain CCMP421" /LENGTH=43 /DNA_ID= /DNA_START= /DNA_END= /DNA_ORIENTATION=